MESGKGFHLGTEAPFRSQLSAYVVQNSDNQRTEFFSIHFQTSIRNLQSTRHFQITQLQYLRVQLSRVLSLYLKFHTPERF